MPSSSRKRSDRCWSSVATPATAGQTDNPMGGLRLDSAEAMLQGGSRGPAIAPGRPKKSLLIRAISYGDPDLKMPPTGRLSHRQIRDLIRWVKRGAPYPSSDPAAIDPADGESGRQFWSFLPIRNPRLPAVKDDGWVSSPIDFFVLSKLEKKGLKPAPPADKRSWIRRVTFGLIGLPPTSGEVERFSADPSPESYQKVVNRLLSSPHYGERWGRHWLDLVSFAETSGHEFDHTKPDVWRYRDTVIRAFNQDVPYDRFIKEHIAGDLLAERRLGPRGIHWESPISTSFFWLGERLNGAIDSVKARADEVDNQIDILSKAFLGLTVACARCHDHKFRPHSHRRLLCAGRRLAQHRLCSGGDRFAVPAATNRLAPSAGRGGDGPYRTSPATGSDEHGRAARILPFGGSRAGLPAKVGSAFRRGRDGRPTRSGGRLAGSLGGNASTSLWRSRSSFLSLGHPGRRPGQPAFPLLCRRDRGGAPGTQWEGQCGRAGHGWRAGPGRRPSSRISKNRTTRDGRSGGRPLLAGRSGEFPPIRPSVTTRDSPWSTLSVGARTSSWAA